MQNHRRMHNDSQRFFLCLAQKQNQLLKTIVLQVNSSRCSERKREKSGRESKTEEKNTCRITIKRQQQPKMYARIRAKTSVANGTGQGKGEGGHRKSDPWATGRPFITCQSNKEHCRLSLGWWFKHFQSQLCSQSVVQAFSILRCAHNRSSTGRWILHIPKMQLITIMIIISLILITGIIMIISIIAIITSIDIFPG